jgi:DUF4097 and DUF4098 domain-containing protein YvlB
MSRIFTWLSAGVLSALLLMTSCGQKLEQAGTEVLEQTYPLDPMARLTIRNLSGSISIRGADTTELKLHATKKAMSAAQLRNINIGVAAETGSISISTSVLPQKGRSVLSGTSSVDYVLIVPRTVKIARLELEDGKVLIEGMEGEDVRATVVDGQLTVRDCCGNIHVAIANGDLDLAYEGCGQQTFLADAQITHGSARVSIPRDASFHVRAQTAMGKIANDFAEMVEVNGQSVRKIDVSVGPAARSQLAVRVTTGDIRIAAVRSDPETGPQTASSAGSE